MNKKILQKILNELMNTEPKLDYLRGMVEVLLEMEGVKIPDDAILASLTASAKSDTPVSEQEILDAKAKAAIEEMKRIEKESLNG